MDAGFPRAVSGPKQTHGRARRTHQADASDAGLGDGTLAHLRGRLPEEEIQLVVIPFRTVGDEVDMDESGICGVEEADIFDTLNADFPCEALVERLRMDARVDRVVLTSQRRKTFYHSTIWSCTDRFAWRSLSPKCGKWPSPFP